VVACPRWFAELAEVTRRPKFAGRFSPAQAQALIEGLLERTLLREDPAASLGLTRDPDDDYLVELAHAAGCEAIVSGDADLRTQDAVRVVSAKEALEAFKVG